MQNSISTLTSARINAYIEWTATRWVSPQLPLTTNRLDHLLVMAMGLSGEAAEIAEVIAQWEGTGQRDDANLRKELGDAMYYWARISQELKVAPPAALNPSPAEDPQCAPVLEALLLVSAAGKVLEAVKKYLRDGTWNQEKVVAGLATFFVCWQLLCEKSGFGGNEVMSANEDKIEGRVARGTQRGSGDDR